MIVIGKVIELLSMSEVLKYLIDSTEPLVSDISKDEWHDLVDRVRGTIVTKPGSVSILQALLLLCLQISTHILRYFLIPIVVPTRLYLNRNY